MQIALMQQIQQTHGNRALQRYLRQSQGAPENPGSLAMLEIAPIQRCGATPCGDDGDAPAVQRAPAAVAEPVTEEAPTRALLVPLASPTLHESESNLPVAPAKTPLIPPRAEKTGPGLSDPAVQRFTLNPLDAAKALAEKALGGIRSLGSAAWDTAQSLGSKAWNSAKEMGSDAWNAAKNGGVAVWNTAKSLGGKAWDSAKSLGTAAWNTAKSTGSTIWNTAQGLGSKAWNTAKSLGTSAWDFAKNTGGKAWNTAKGLGSAVWNTAQSLGSSAWSGVKSFAGTAWDGVKTFGGTVWSTVKGTAGKAWDTVKGLGGQALDVAKAVADRLAPTDLCKAAGNLMAKTYAKVAPYVKKAWASAKSLGSQAWNSAKTLGSKLWDTAKEWGGKAAAVAKNEVAKITKEVKARVGNAWASAKQLGSQVLQGAKDYAGKAWDGAKSLGTAAWDQAKSLAGGLYSKAKSLGATAVDKATALASGAWDTAKSLGSKITAQAENAAGKLLGMADKLTGGAASKVAGMAQSILGKAGGLLSWVMNTAQDLANKAINAAKDWAAKTLATAKEWGAKALNGAKDYAQKAWDEAKTLGAQAVSTAKDWAGKAWSVASEWGSKAIGVAKDWAGKAWSFAKEYGGRALGTAKDWAGKAWSVVKEYGGKAWSTVSGWGGKAWAVAKDAGSKAWGYAKGVGGKVASYAKGVGGKVWNTAKDYGSKAYQVVREGVAKLNAKKLLGLAALLGFPVPIAGGAAALSALLYVGRSKCVQELAPAVAGPIGELGQASPMIEGMFKVVENPDVLVQATKASVSGMIAKVGPEARTQVTAMASRFGARIRKHLSAILYFLEAGVTDLGNTWWDQLQTMGRQLLFPWEGMGGQLKSMGGDLVSAVKNFWSLNFSAGIDNILSMLRTVNGILGNWYGWFAIASVLIGAVIGAFFGGAGAIPGAGAGLAFAGEVGEGLLAAFVATEVASIGKAGFDLARGEQTAAEDAADEKQIANSAITLGITGAMVLLSDLAAKFAEGVFSRLSGLFRDLKAPKDIELKPGEVKPGETTPGGEKSGDVKPGDEKAVDPSLAEHKPTGDGKHELFEDDKGFEMCSANCDLMRKKFADVLEGRPDLKGKLTKLENMPETTPQEIQAKEAAREKIYEELRDTRIDQLLKEVDEKFRDQIDQALEAGDVAKANDIRYQRYLERCQAKGLEQVDILNRAEWDVARERIEANRVRGNENENAALKAAGVDNNNLATTAGGDPRSPVEFNTKEGPRRPDGISDTKIIDVKSIEDGVIYDTEQLRAFKRAGRRGLPDGQVRDLAVIISGTDAVLADGTPKVRPSGPLVVDATVLHRSPTTGEWALWDPQLRGGQGGWKPISQARATELLGGKVPPTP